MAILMGFPPSNTISPGTRITQQPKFGSKNPWVQRKQARTIEQTNFKVKSKLIVPDAKLLEEMKAASKAAFAKQEAAWQS